MIFRDSFERADLGEDYHPTSGAWHLDQGQLCGREVRNHPVWFVRPLPTNARIEFDAVSRSSDGDIKVEAWGDGRSAATGRSYTNATSYVVIFGGWKNQLHVLARLNEHGGDRQAITIDPAGTAVEARPVVPNRTYHFKLERADGRTLRWLVDDIEITSFVDPAPLAGDGHEHFGFNDWEAEVCFDNLVVTPL
ncbi:MAG: hypothetical protein JW751_07610 [Polyangiaceae bacterium]|nr:hypothetical protein [Polyangiaceae bacterium]